jgi:hypothetical protein
MEIIMANENQAITAPSNGGSSIVRQGFGESSVERRHETAATAVAAQAQAEVQARYIVAMQHPRDDDNVRVRLLKECSRPSFAQRAFFSVQRGNKPGRLTGTPNRIEGLSVRFAEAAIRHMGNAMASTRSVYDDAEKRIVNVTVVDLETNAVHAKDIVVSKTVERRKLGQGQLALKTRTNSYGDTVYIVESTDDELLQKENALVSKTLRTEALRLLPADTIEECEQRIVATVKNEDAKDPDAARKALADGFAALNIMPSDIKSYLGHDLAQCSPAQLTDLRGLYAAIREGETTWQDILSAKADASGAAATDPAGAQVAAEPEKAKARGSRLATQAREKAAAGAPATTTQTPTPGVQALVAGVQAPVDATKGGSAQQAGMFSPQPVIPSAAVPESIEESRAREFAVQKDLQMNWRGEAGTPVTVSLPGQQQPYETYTKGPPRMFGDMAVINVNGIEGPVALSTVTKIDKPTQ